MGYQLEVEHLEYAPYYLSCDMSTTLATPWLSPMPLYSIWKGSVTAFITFFNSSFLDTYLYYYPVGETPDVDGGGVRIPFSDS